MNHPFGAGVVAAAAKAVVGHHRTGPGPTISVGKSLLACRVRCRLAADGSFGLSVVGAEIVGSERPAIEPRAGGENGLVYPTY